MRRRFAFVLPLVVSLVLLFDREIAIAGVRLCYRVFENLLNDKVLVVLLVGINQNQAFWRCVRTDGSRGFQFHWDRQREITLTVTFFATRLVSLRASIVNLYACYVAINYFAHRTTLARIIWSLLRCHSRIVRSSCYYHLEILWA